MTITLCFSLLIAFNFPAQASHGRFAEMYDDDHLLSEEEYVTKGPDAETYEETGDYFEDFAERVLAVFVLRAEQLGFATELFQPPTPEQTGVTIIEVSPGIIRYYDTSRINRAIHAALTDENGKPLLDDEGDPLHFKPNHDDIQAAYQALPDDPDLPRHRRPYPTHELLWIKHFGPPE